MEKIKKENPDSSPQQIASDVSCALALETSTQKPSVAFWNSSECSPDLEPSRSHDLVGAIKAHFEATSTSLDDLDLLIVSGGPGSYTGLRIGFSLIQGLAITRQIPVLVYPSPLALAQAWRSRSPDFSGTLGVLLDSKAQMVLGQRFNLNQEDFSPLEEMVYTKPNEIADEWDSEVFVVGSGYATYQSLFSERGFKGQTLWPQAQGLIDLWRQNIPGSWPNVKQMNPLYVRDPVG